MSSTRIIWSRGASRFEIAKAIVGVLGKQNPRTWRASRRCMCEFLVAQQLALRSSIGAFARAYNECLGDLLTIYFMCWGPGMQSTICTQVGWKQGRITDAGDVVHFSIPHNQEARWLVLEQRSCVRKEKCKWFSRFRRTLFSGRWVKAHWWQRFPGVNRTEEKADVAGPGLQMQMQMQALKITKNTGKQFRSWSRCNGLGECQRLV